MALRGPARHRLTAVDPVQSDGLLTIGERVIFRHPLVRSAVYRSASPEDRRAAHLALAEITDRKIDPARRAWHLAAAAPGPDEEIAMELERSASLAQARGGLAAAASFLRRSVELTADPTRRSDRALAAAAASLRAGAFDSALGSLAAAEAGPLSEMQRARVELLRADARYSQSRGNEGAPLLLRAAKRLESLDPRLARETYLDAWGAALFAGARATGATLQEVSRHALSAPRAEGSTLASDLLLEGFSLAMTDGRVEAMPILRRAAAAFCGEDASADEVLRWGSPSAHRSVRTLAGCRASHLF